MRVGMKVGMRVGMGRGRGRLDCCCCCCCFRGREGLRGDVGCGFDGMCDCSWIRSQSHAHVFDFEGMIMP